MSNLFKPAVKEAAKLRLAIAGPSGSGKTYTSLAVGTALANGGKVAVVDTEHGSASKYADLFTFDVMELHAPFHPDRFSDAIHAAEQAGYAVLILDSMSHAWNGAGGLLEIVDNAAKKYRGNTYAGWGEGTPIQNRLIETITGAGIHIIATMRSKQDYILVEKNGKQTPQKVGMAPVQRDGFEYEFDVFLDMDIENNAIVSKTRCPALTGKVINKPGDDLAGILAEWLTGAEPVKVQRPAAPAPASNGRKPSAPPPPEPEPVEADAPKPTLSMKRKFHATGVDLYGDEWDDKRPELTKAISKGRVTSSNELTFDEMHKLIEGMEVKLAERQDIFIEGINGEFKEPDVDAINGELFG